MSLPPLRGLRTLAGLLLLPLASPGAIELTPLRPPQLWQRAEFRLAGLPTAANAFDPDQIRVDAAITSPSGTTSLVPAFWFQDYTRALVDGADRRPALGVGEQHVAEVVLGRFVGLEPGRRGVREVVGELVLTDLLGEHPGGGYRKSGVHAGILRRASADTFSVARQQMSWVSRRR